VTPEELAQRVSKLVLKTDSATENQFAWIVIIGRCSLAPVCIGQSGQHQEIAHRSLGSEVGFIDPELPTFIADRLKTSAGLLAELNAWN
jgi:hypothetical protein